MKKYILKYKLLNLIHIILIGFSSAFLVGASVTLSIMLNNLEFICYFWQIHT